MIELHMVRRMSRRALWITPVVVAVAALIGGVGYGVSAAVGIAMTLANLWLAARIIGGVAKNNPALLMGAGLAAFALGLGLLTGIALWLQTLSLITFEVTGFVLIGAHLLLVLWEASGAYSSAGTEPRS